MSVLDDGTGLSGSLLFTGWAGRLLRIVSAASLAYNTPRHKLVFTRKNDTRNHTEHRGTVSFNVLASQLLFAFGLLCSEVFP